MFVTFVFVQYKILYMDYSFVKPRTQETGLTKTTKVVCILNENNVNALRWIFKQSFSRNESELFGTIGKKN